MPLDLTDKLTLVQVMAWCRQATSHYLNQCWPKSLPPYGVTRPQWVKSSSSTCIQEIYNTFYYGSCLIFKWAYPVLFVWLLSTWVNMAVAGQTTTYHYDDVVTGAMVSQITSLTIVYSIVYSGIDQRKHQSSITGLCAGNSPGTGEFPAERASYAENVSIWWRHHVEWKHPNICLWKNLYCILS